jgi:hypothetical protein
MCRKFQDRHWWYESPAHEEMVMCAGELDEDLVHDIGAV